MPIAQLPGVPGGPEVLILVVYVLIALLVVVFVYRLLQTFGGSSDERIADLERRVEKLERERE